MAAKPVREEWYEIYETRPIGYGIIVANKFENTEHARNGTAAEIVLMTEIFTKLGFEPIIFGEVTKEEFIEKMRNIRNDEKLNKHNIIALAIFSHGYRGYIYFPKLHVIQGIQEFVAPATQEQIGQSHDLPQSQKCDQTCDSLSVDKIKNSISCPSMKDKPKLIILNACRGPQADAELYLPPTHKFILYSTKDEVLSSKFQYGSHGDISPFLRMLYKSVSELGSYDDFRKIDEKINKHYQELPEMKPYKSEQAEMVIEEKATSHKLCLKTYSSLANMDELLNKSVQKVQIQKEKKQIIKEIKSVTSIAYNPKQSCYYICDLLQSKLFTITKNFDVSPLELEPPLKSPRYIECIDAGSKLIISHELGLSMVKLRGTKIDNKHEKLGKDITYISPCIAQDKKGILYILNRFGNEENHQRQITSWHFTDNNKFHEGIVELRIEREHNYSPIITDMNFRTDHILILAYLPSPCLLTYIISKGLNEISKAFVHQFKIDLEPCFIASTSSYTLLSSPKTGIVKLPQRTENLVGQKGIKNTNAVYIHEDGDAIITEINGNECILHKWKGLADVVD
ncbi:hypothetical protein LOD99_5826 [Oopsacas minuta]|uniref:Caspase family p20 domain-containing protein n=1 Tax=Oopsacas minuta TaxID=111878 RepID=A0AAV7JPD0_9METZ|nr:hypothetical protein LOD99_5826 [Oopsacas minuta]